MSVVGSRPARAGGGGASVGQSERDVLVAGEGMIGGHHDSRAPDYAGRGYAATAVNRDHRAADAANGGGEIVGESSQGAGGRCGGAHRSSIAVSDA